MGSDVNQNCANLKIPGERKCLQHWQLGSLKIRRNSGQGIRSYSRRYKEMTQKFWVLRRPRVKAAVDDDAVQKLDMEPWGLKEKEMHYIQGDGVFWGAIKLIGLQFCMVCSESKSVLMRWIYVSPNQFKIIVVFSKNQSRSILPETRCHPQPSALALIRFVHAFFIKME